MADYYDQRADTEMALWEIDTPLRELSDSTSGAEKDSRESGRSSRAAPISRCREYLGVSENRFGCNRGSPQRYGWELVVELTARGLPRLSAVRSA